MFDYETEKIILNHFSNERPSFTVNQEFYILELCRPSYCFVWFGKHPELEVDKVESNRITLRANALRIDFIKHIIAKLKKQKSKL